MIASPGFDTFQAGSLFAVANPILFGTEQSARAV
jgi:hypothetical protein